MKLNNLNEYDYELPADLVALEPIKPRSNSRLLVYDRGTILDTRFNYLFKYLKPKDRLIFNNTKVLNARLLGTRVRDSNTGTGRASVEILLIQRIAEGQWSTLCKPSKKIKKSDSIIFSDCLSAKVVIKNTDTCILNFSKTGDELDQEISNIGQLPLPPYILKNRKYMDSDTTNDQPIFASRPGAIASPTASLHFDDDLLFKLKDYKIDFSFITLHVGLGTFLPIKTNDISAHKMHYEKGIIDKNTAIKINNTKAAGGRIICVGTTSLRLIEGAALSNNTLKEFNGNTTIFIKPGYKFKMVDGLITNFHFPKSTLLILISAFVGNEERKRIYNHAIKEKFRFFSYGDSSLLLPDI